MCHAVRFNFTIIVIAAGEVGQDLCLRVCVIYVLSQAKKSNKNRSYSSETNFPTGNHLNYTTINKKKNRNEINLC